MKKLILAFGVLLLTFSSCTKDYKYQSEGIITGQDGRYCACCGGWFIEIEETTYRFYELPINSGIKLDKDNFPIQVQLNWDLKDNACMGDEIIVSGISEY